MKFAIIVAIAVSVLTTLALNAMKSESKDPCSTMECPYEVRVDHETQDCFCEAP